MAVTAAMAVAQTGSGAIQGTVRDSSGAVIPNAAVKAVHVSTARSYDSVTNEVGIFVLPSLQIGNYRITVESPGMRPWQADLLLTLGQTAAVSPVLEVGASTSSVVVAGDVTSLVVQNSPTLGSIVERSRIEQLPLNGRFLVPLISMTTPGLEGDRPYGLWGQGNAWYQDGAPIVNREQNTNSMQYNHPVGIDTIQELRVESNNSSAQFSRPSSTILSTKSGTNQIHGSLFETARNSGLGVARRRQDFYEKAPQLVRNEFGGSVGGPVYFPKLYNGKNRTFFFFGYEAFRQAAGTTAAITMPTMQMRQGDFSALYDSVGRKITIYDPYTTDSRTWQRLPFAGNVIPANRQSPLSRYLYSVTPAPTHPNINPLVASNFFGPGPNNRVDHNETYRIDHRVSDKDHVFFRFSYSDENQESLGWATNASVKTLDGNNNTYLPTHNRNGVVSWTRNFSPTLFSETVISHGYEAFLVFSGQINENWATKLGLPNPFLETGYPCVTNTGFVMKYMQVDTRRDNRTWATTIEENLTKVRGRHELRFGGRLYNVRNHYRPDQPYNAGLIDFGGGATALYDSRTGSTYGAVPQTGFAGANFFMGLANYYQIWRTQGMMRWREREYALYFQDNYRIAANLTLNLGLRYEYTPPLHERSNLQQGFDMAARAIVNGPSLDELYQMGRTSPSLVSLYQNLGVKFTNPEAAGLPDRLITTSPWGFLPRAGFAYKLPAGRRTFVVRGGYAIYGMTEDMRNFSANMRGNPPFGAYYQTLFNAAEQSPDGLPNYALRSVPTVVAGVNSSNAIDPTKPVGISRGSFATYFWDPDQPFTRVHEWNLTLEREVMENTVARVGYVANHGSNIPQWESLNPAVASDYVWFVTRGTALPTGATASVARRTFDTTTYGDIFRYQKSGWSNFNGVQLELQRRFTKGYAFQVFYLMGNALRVAGNGTRDNVLTQAAAFLPGAVPSEPQEANRFLNYARDTSVPKHRISYNWLMDLPVGRGKRFASGAGGFLNRVVGGWQLAGYGTMRSNYWALPTGNFGTLGTVEVYGKQFPIEDCRSGACIPGYLYYNGYIPSNRINSYDAAGKPNGVMGVPKDYKPASTPIHTDPTSTYYGTNTIWVKLNNGANQQTTLNTGLHPWRNQFMGGLWNFVTNASLFKATPITERLMLRLNADFFNVFNQPGLNQPDSNSGIVSLQNSAQGARQMQVTVRLTW